MANKKSYHLNGSGSYDATDIPTFQSKDTKSVKVVKAHKKLPEIQIKTLCMYKHGSHIIPAIAIHAILYNNRIPSETGWTKSSKMQRHYNHKCLWLCRFCVLSFDFVLDAAIRLCDWFRAHFSRRSAENKSENHDILYR